jgi:hypothetical protein
MLLPAVRPLLGTPEGVSCECAVTTGLFGNGGLEPGGAFTHQFGFVFVVQTGKRDILTQSGLSRELVLVLLALVRCAADPLYTSWTAGQLRRRCRHGRRAGARE